MREREIHQKNIENEVNIRPKIDAKSIQISYSEKLCKKHRKSSTIELKREPKTIQKPIKNNADFFLENGGPDQCRAGSGNLAFGAFSLSKDRLS